MSEQPGTAEQSAAIEEWRQRNEEFEAKISSARVARVSWNPIHLLRKLFGESKILDEGKYLSHVLQGNMLGMFPLVDDEASGNNPIKRLTREEFELLTDT